jgi:hypothetical protein
LIGSFDAQSPLGRDSSLSRLLILFSARGKTEEDTKIHGALMSIASCKFPTAFAIVFLMLFNPVVAGQTVEKQSRSLSGEWRFEMDYRQWKCHID